jgi:putative tryptophan/tyrosine transport system substrate-binding protein
MKTAIRYKRTGYSKQLKVSAVALCAILFALCMSAEAQQEKKLARIGYLGNRSYSDTPWMNEFRAGLSELGYMEGQNIIIDYRYWEGKLERLPELAAQLVRLNCDVLLTGGVEATEAAKNATKTIPIVMAFSGADPVRRGIITSLAQPGGNITGLASINADLSGKRLELLKEVVPKLSKMAVLSSPTGPAGPTGLKETQAVAQSLGITIQSFEVKNPDEIEGVFKTATKQRVGALMVQPGGFVGLHGKRIVELAEKNRLPAVYPSITFVDAGALMLYAEDRMAHFRRAAWYVDKILKGAKPASLPAEQPTKFYLVINLNAAKRIGLAIPPNVLARADKVIR